MKSLRSAPLAYGLLAKSRIPDEIAKSYTGPPARNREIRRDVNKFIRSTSPSVTMQVARELRSFDRPVLLLWTPEDRLFPVSLAERLAREIAPFVAAEAAEGARAPFNSGTPSLGLAPGDLNRVFFGEAESGDRETARESSEPGESLAVRLPPPPPAREHLRGLPLRVQPIDLNHAERW